MFVEIMNEKIMKENCSLVQFYNLCENSECLDKIITNCNDGLYSKTFTNTCNNFIKMYNNEVKNNPDINMYDFYLDCRKKLRKDFERIVDGSYWRLDYILENKK